MLSGLNKKSLITLLFSGLITVQSYADENHYELALKAYQQKDVNTAEIHLKNALKENTKNLPAKLLLAEVYIDKSSPHLAEQELNNALLQGADFNLVVEPLARSLLFQGKYEQIIMLDADQTLNQRSQLNFDLVKAKAYLATDDIGKAQEIYQSIIGLMPNNIKANIGLANLYLDDNAYSKAEAIINNIEAVAQKNIEFLQVKGRLLLMLGELKPALVLFEQANLAEPNNIKTLKYIVNTHIALKKFNKAEKLIDTILTLAPKDPHAQFLKSSILRDLDKVVLSEQVLMQLSTQLAAIDSQFMVSQPQLQLLDAMTSYAQGNWEQARNKLKSYLDNEPDDVSAAVLLADVYMRQEQGRDALKLLSEYEAQLMFNKEYAIILAGLYIQFNKSFKAEPYLTSLNQQYPNDTSILILMAQVLSEREQTEQAYQLLKNAQVEHNALFLETLAAVTLKLGKLEESQTYVSKIIEMAPENVSYQLLHAQTLLQQGNVTKANELITKLYNSQLDNADVQFNYGLLQQILGKNNEARKVFRALVTDHPEHSEAWLKLAGLEYQLGDTAAAIHILDQQKKNSKTKTLATYQLAELYYREREFDKSLSLISSYLLSNRLDTYAGEIKAKNLIALERNEAAKLQLSQLFGFWLEDADKLLNLSRLQIQVKDYEGAEKSLALALKLKPNTLPIFIDTIKLKLRQEKLVEAESLIRDAERSGFKNDIYINILKGDVARAKNNLGSAYSLYAKALKQDENNVIALFKLAQISHTKQLSQQFIPFLTSVVNNNPDAGLIRKTLAEHLLTHKHWEQALFQYQVLLTKPLPTDQRAIALNNVAVIYIEQQEYSLAVSFAKQAVSVTNTIPGLIDTLGWALTLSGELNEGLSYLRQAYTMASSSIEVQYHLAYALAKLGRTEEAVEYLEFIVISPAKIVEVELAKQLLAELTN
ncbi:XrtA/PEP-CTERM system TPR-repeat protein PrsT [Thalassotalea agariperforans]